MKCKDCVYCWSDDRITAYRRRDMSFCRKKGTLFSRNYRPGEETRILPEDDACPWFCSK